MSAAFELRFDIIQGSQDWLSLRRTKITSKDAPIIMGAFHKKTKIQLYKEKKEIEVKPVFINKYMKDGMLLEEDARNLFIAKTGIEVKPAIAIRGWAMSSLDGISACGKYGVEIKVPGEKNHQIALSGNVPPEYYPQVQHHMYVLGLDEFFYFSFDKIDGDPFIVKRDNEYIEKMEAEEKKFFDCLSNNKMPEPSENDYLERSDELWQSCANRWKSVSEAIKELEKEEDELRKQLIFLSGESNTKGGGVSLCQIIRKGNIDYGKVPQLKGVDLEPYRKPSIQTWRITF
jgi:putative phage-type endonuclease